MSKIRFNKVKNRDGVKEYKIFLGTQDIAGMMLRLHNAFDEMGIVNNYYCIYEYEFGAGNDEKYKNDELKSYKKHTEHVKKMYWAGHRIRFRLWQLVQMFDVLWIFIKALFRYNSFIYIFGRGLFFRNFYLSKIQFLEYWILKLFKKKVIMWCCGDDVRPPYCGCFNGDSKAVKSATRQRAKTVRMQERCALMISSPAYSHFHNRPYINCMAIGIPIDKNEIVKRKDRKQVICKAEKYGSQKVVILHAPSAQKWKGSDVVKKIITNIKNKGYSIEFIEVTGVTHDVVLKMIAESDIVVDQVFSDTPMAGFASEAAINGVPVVVSGYYADYDQYELCKPIPPTCFCRPDQLEEVLISLIKDEQFRKKVGMSEQKFILENWMAQDVAKRMLRLIDGTFPKEWLNDPWQNAYIWGIGNRKAEVAEKVVDLVDHYGTKALCLPRRSIRYCKYVKLYEKKTGLRI